MTSAGSRTKTGKLIDVIFVVRSMVIEHTKKVVLATSVGNRTQTYSLIDVKVVVEGVVIFASVLLIRSIRNVIVAI